MEWKIDYLNSCSSKQKELYHEVIHILQLMNPSITAVLHKGVPGFYYRGPFAYLNFNSNNESSILTFTRGFLFEENGLKLNLGEADTKERSIKIDSNNPINWLEIQEYLVQAIYWQEQLSKRCNC